MTDNRIDLPATDPALAAAGAAREVGFRQAEAMIFMETYRQSVESGRAMTVAREDAAANVQAFRRTELRA